MARRPEESGLAWRDRVTADLAQADVALDQHEERISYGEVPPGQPVPVITTEHAAAGGRVDLLQAEQEKATEAWLRER